MMKPDIVVPFELPALNEVIALAKRQQKQIKKIGNRQLTLTELRELNSKNVSYYNSMKRLYTANMTPFLKAPRIDKPTDFHFHWYCRNRRKNPDNIAAGGRKIIFDALQTVGILPDDNWQWVIGLRDKFFVDKQNPRVEVFFR